MKFERISRELYGRPWCISPATYTLFHDVFQSRLQDAKFEYAGIEVEYKLPQEYGVYDGVAIIEIDGAMGHRLPTMEKACMGMVDYRDIRAAIAKANADPSVDGIVLDINSPGGAVTGLKETAQAIRQSEKPVVGYTDSLAASAGYYLMTAADAAIATESAEIGCIGTLMTWLDVTAAYEAEGVKREMIASGKYKGMLFPGLELTEEQRELLQQEVDYLADEFKDFVAESRQVDESAMEGQTFVGSLALAENLIDKLADITTAAEIAKGELMSKVKTRKEILEEYGELQQQHENATAEHAEKIGELESKIQASEQKVSELVAKVAELTEQAEKSALDADEARAQKGKLKEQLGEKVQRIGELEAALADPSFVDASMVASAIDQTLADVEADNAEAVAAEQAEKPSDTPHADYFFSLKETAPSAASAYWRAHAEEINKEMQRING